MTTSRVAREMAASSSASAATRPPKAGTTTRRIRSSRSAESAGLIRPEQRLQRTPSSTSPTCANSASRPGESSAGCAAAARRAIRSSCRGESESPPGCTAASTPPSPPPPPPSRSPMVCRASVTLRRAESAAELSAGQATASQPASSAPAMAGNSCHAKRGSRSDESQRSDGVGGCASATTRKDGCTRISERSAAIWAAVRPYCCWRLSKGQPVGPQPVDAVEHAEVPFLRRLHDRRAGPASVAALVERASLQQVVARHIAVEGHTADVIAEPRPQLLHQSALAATGRPNKAEVRACAVVLDEGFQAVAQRRGLNPQRRCQAVCG
eukprot:7383210-Prymnesium_polylepis.2